MTIQYASDLHLEFPENAKFLRDNPLTPSAEILVLAGDILPFAMMDRCKDFFNYLSDNFHAVYWLPGNHEYYHSDIVDRCGHLMEKVRCYPITIPERRSENGYGLPSCPDSPALPP